MRTTIWYLTCPTCRRRYPARTLGRTANPDYSVIDYPVQSGVSLGCRGFKVTDYVGWSRLTSLSTEVLSALSVFFARVAMTYALLRELGLIPTNDYVETYTKWLDDVPAAYDREAFGYGAY